MSGWVGGWRESARLNQSSGVAYLPWLPAQLAVCSPPFVLLKEKRPCAAEPEKP